MPGQSLKLTFSMKVLYCSFQGCFAQVAITWLVLFISKMQIPTSDYWCIWIKVYMKDFVISVLQMWLLCFLLRFADSLAKKNTGMHEQYLPRVDLVKLRVERQGSARSWAREQEKSCCTHGASSIWWRKDEQLTQTTKCNFSYWIRAVKVIK